MSCIFFDWLMWQTGKRQKKEADKGGRQRALAVWYTDETTMQERWREYRIDKTLAIVTDAEERIR